MSVPVHGERRHIKEHARYALSLQVLQAITPDNGGRHPAGWGRLK